MKKYFLFISIISFFWICQALAISPQEILFLTNAARKSNGLPEYTLNNCLEKAATLKARDMDKYNYFSHVSLTGARAGNFARKYNYRYFYLGENLAINFTSSTTVFSSWMASPMHRGNILDKDFKEAGVGIRGAYTVMYFGSSLYQCK